MTEVLAVPQIPTIAATRCVVCGGEQWHECGSSQDYEYETCANTWTFQSCARCGHVQIHPLPAPEALSVIYPEHYYSYVMEKSVHPLALWAKSRMDLRKFDWITNGLTQQLGAYLDVGCGDGRYLQMMIEAGARPEAVYGVELDARAVEAAKSRGLQVLQTRIEDAAGLRPDFFDLITMFHVIEHVARPDQVVLRLRNLLKIGGVLALETPNFDCADARLFGRRYWGAYHTPRHWHIFTVDSLSRLLVDSGFSVQRIRYQTGHAFLLWTLHHWLKYGRRLDTLARWCHPLRNLPLLAAATSLDMMRIALGRKTSAMLLVARREC